MKFLHFILLVTTLTSQISAATSLPSLDKSFNLLSFNIRYNTPKDGLNAWPNRKQHVSALIQFHQADVVGLQEATLGQLDNLTAALPNYKWTGRARDDGKTDSSGEYAAILYNQENITLLKQGSFWCSTTPDIPSKGWDTSLRRNINWAYFKHNNGSQFYLFNAHFDHEGNIARTECAKLLRQRIDKIAKVEAVIVTGDFNAEPTSKTYLNLTDNRQYKKDIFDASKISLLKPYGPAFTFTAFDINAKRQYPIDYVLVSSEFKVKRFGVLNDSLNGRLPSDHYPVLVDVEFK